MKRTASSRFIAAAVLAAAALGAVSSAQARTDVQVSIGLPGFPVVVPQPVFAPPRPVYGPPPAVVYERPGRQTDWQRQAWERREWERRDMERRAWERREWERRAWERREADRHQHGPARGGYHRD